ncbi:helix-turn-helix domain-containing protein [Mammaliicoccus vitulinus]|uniref:helix-turn-helix domain-containing protein n=2 Tax=Mammaliicoccus vitulinus TaxID=71237 RepID=UPI000D1E7A48|nr:XRE family transcriptional regulator [Mammaliicoccus vitulinus]MBM6630213.1 helix-turn-helix transcriptional regulator [Mammaliicoccus vitulinus]MEB7657425.1 XRE family transcriptional regulator [Mammaliicoccus vitulinus]PTI38446.1 transcriptional regulator [Mammaliicoccus vitulinus]PTI70556.1 transcriptional regulator [Mammaliicoccus vitulinus]QTN11090.1 helix-turn-helix domain-containing protein [Mammaliicoccus vitulinus]
MKDIHTIVAHNLSQYRTSQQLSLSTVSKRTGVSKTMLNQIENGQSNPTITTLWKIANGLHLPISDLISNKDDNINCVSKADIVPIYNDDQTVIIYPYFPFNIDKNFEMFNMELTGNAEMVSEGHHVGSEEYIIVHKGVLEIEINGHKHTIKQDDAIHFESDVTHTYRNISNEDVHLTATIQYNK